MVVGARRQRLGLFLELAPAEAELLTRHVGHDAAPPPLTQRPADAFPYYSRHRTDVALGHSNRQDEEIWSALFTDLINQTENCSGDSSRRGKKAVGSQLIVRLAQPPYEKAIRSGRLRMLSQVRRQARARCQALSLTAVTVAERGRCPVSPTRRQPIRAQEAKRFAPHPCLS